MCRLCASETLFSKLADVIPMEERDGEHVLKALRTSFKKMGYPMSVYSMTTERLQLKIKFRMSSTVKE